MLAAIGLILLLIACAIVELTALLTEPSSVHRHLRVKATVLCIAALLAVMGLGCLAAAGVDALLSWMRA